MKQAVTGTSNPKARSAIAGLKVMAAIVGNRVTRLNNPMMAAKLHELKQRAEQTMKSEE